jgi:hypothetical protein
MDIPPGFTNHGLPPPPHFPHTTTGYPDHGVPLPLPPPGLEPFTVVTTHTDPLTGVTTTTTTTTTTKVEQTQVPNFYLPKEERIPKPRNSWIIYRAKKHAEMVEANANMPVVEVSKRIAEMWRAEKPEVKAEYASLAQLEKEEHERRYPGWKVRPRKSKEIRKRGRAKVEKTY